MPTTLRLALAMLATPAAGMAAQQPVYDLVILGGRVMDPASGLDAVRAVGITGATIRVISRQSLRGRDTLNAR